jgi:hypothetical protein
MSGADPIAHQGPAPVERQMAATAAIVLGQGKLVDDLSRCLTVASLVGLVSLCLLAGRSAILTILLIGTAATAGLVELWFAGRVATDSALFRHLSVMTEGPDWASLDGALTGLRLLPPAKAGRMAVQRIAGAFRLLRYQTAVLIVQFALIVAGAVAGIEK